MQLGVPLPPQGLLSLALSHTHTCTHTHTETRSPCGTGWALGGDGNRVRPIAQQILLQTCRHLSKTTKR